MLTHRTNLLLERADYLALTQLAKKKKTSLGSLVRNAIKEKYFAPTKKISKHFDYVKEGMKLLKDPYIPLNYRDLINEGRKY